MGGTAHINAAKGDFARRLLLPGDPLRAKYIAENFLDNAQEVTGVRGMLGFTGTYKASEVSVMGSGMGMPSASIYCHELATEFGVEEIIRIGSCGTTLPDVELNNVLAAIGACTDSAINRTAFSGFDFAATANYDLLSSLVSTARERRCPIRVGNVFTSDVFYSPSKDYYDVLQKYGVLGIDMEAAGLYFKAAELGIKALAIMTVTDHLGTGAALSADERQSSLNDMIELALDTFSQR